MFITMQQAIRKARALRREMPSPDDQVIAHDGMTALTPSQAAQRYAQRIAMDDEEGLMSGFEDV
jgi:hypothetical protein